MQQWENQGDSTRLWLQHEQTWNPRCQQWIRRHKKKKNLRTSAKRLKRIKCSGAPGTRVHQLVHTMNSSTQHPSPRTGYTHECCWAQIVSSKICEVRDSSASPSLNGVAIREYYWYGKGMTYKCKINVVTMATEGCSARRWERGEWYAAVLLLPWKPGYTWTTTQDYFQAYTTMYTTGMLHNMHY